MTAGLRSALEGVFREALDAVRGGPAVTSAIGEGMGRAGAQVEVLAAGKAAVPMLRAAADALGERVVCGLAVAKDHEGPPPARCEVLLAGHPVPDARSEAAGRRWLAFVAAVPPERDLLVLLSGGASALLSCPAPGLELVDLQTATDGLLRAGADIEALNAVRKHLGAVGGGRSLEACRSGSIEVLAISDVPGDRLDLLGSGPFCADPHRYLDALAAFERFPRAGLPPRVGGFLEAGARGEHPETLKDGAPALARTRHRVIASLDDALAAAARAARARAFGVRRWPEPLAGEARELAPGLAAALRAAPPHTCVIAGGEPTVTVRGAGRGGRAQELALALALEIAGVAGCGALAAGTDGSDGPTDAAGAWADGGTVERARRAGVDAVAALADNDSHRLFDVEGGLLRTGPTGTNVNDLVLLGTTE